MKFNLKSLLKLDSIKSTIVATCVFMSACSNGTLPELSIDKVTIYTDSDANQNSAIAVDLVIVYDEEVEKMLASLSAAKYFAMSQQLLLDNPTLLDIWHWELVPGQIVQNFEPPQEQGDAFAAYVYANYLTPGDHRLKVAPTGVIKILLQKNELLNLGDYDLHAVRSGTTMSNEVTQRGSNQDEDEDDVGLPTQLKVGPVSPPSEPPMPAPNCGPVCAPSSPSIQMQPVAQGPCVPAPQAKPIPIVTKPLYAPKLPPQPRPMAPVRTICPPKQPFYKQPSGVPEPKAVRLKPAFLSPSVDSTHAARPAIPSTSHTRKPYRK